MLMRTTLTLDLVKHLVRRYCLCCTHMREDATRLRRAKTGSMMQITDDLMKDLLARLSNSFRGRVLMGCVAILLDSVFAQPSSSNLNARWLYQIGSEGFSLSTSQTGRSLFRRPCLLSEQSFEFTSSSCFNLTGFHTRAIIVHWYEKSPHFTLPPCLREEQISLLNIDGYNVMITDHATTFTQVSK